MTQFSLSGALLLHSDKHPFIKLPSPLLLKFKPCSGKAKSTTVSHPQSITTFPVRVHKEDDQINQGAMNARRNFKNYARNKDSRSHSAGPFGNFFSVSWPNGKTERVKLATEIIESLWIYDDVMEDVDHAGAVAVHASVRDTLTGAEEPSKKNMIADLFRDFGTRLSQMDKQGAPRVLAALKDYLDNYDSEKTPFDTIQEYTEYRILNVGYGIMDSFMQWTMGIQLNEAEAEAAREFYMSAGRVMGLTNDLYSWNVERTEAVDDGDRKWNAVPVIMQQYRISEKEATSRLQNMIRKHETVTQKLGEDLLRRFEYSKTMSNYVESVGLMLGGNCFWSATCPRYNP